MGGEGKEGRQRERETENHQLPNTKMERKKCSSWVTGGGGGGEKVGCRGIIRDLAQPRPADTDDRGSSQA